MFIGHYAPAALGAATGKIKLWQACLGAQLVDIFWAGLILTGTENVRIVPGFTEASALDLYHMPYTHALGMDVLWALLAIAVFALVFRRQAKTGAVIFGFVVLSHWLMDYIVHVPDLPLWFGSEKFGLGLWNHRAVSFPLELILAFGALFIYLRASQPKPQTGTVNWGKISPLILIGVMTVLQIISNFGPPPKSIPELSLSAFFAYGILTGLAAFVDRCRTIDA